MNREYQPASASEHCSENNSCKKESALAIEQQLQQCQTSLADWQEKFARLGADFDNFKKRTVRERASWDEAVRADVLLGLLSIVDNFDRATQQPPRDLSGDMQAWVSGIEMIHSAFNDYLKNAGISEMSYGTFDPERHEALMQHDSEQHAPGTIIAVLEKGYVLNDRVLRPAKVSVAK